MSGSINLYKLFETNQTEPNGTKLILNIEYKKSRNAT